MINDRAFWNGLYELLDAVNSVFNFSFFRNCQLSSEYSKYFLYI